MTCRCAAPAPRAAPLPCWLQTLFQHEIFLGPYGPGSASSGAGALVHPGGSSRSLPPSASAAAPALPPLPEELAPWVKQLCYFLSYFPDKEVGVGLMHELQGLRHALRLRLAKAAQASARSRPASGAGAREAVDTTHWAHKPDGANWVSNPQ